VRAGPVPGGPAHAADEPAVHRRRVVPQLYPADVPLPRERSKQPYGAAEVGGFLALADAQPTRERRMRAAALVCLGPAPG
jgi:hypothetical protein